MNYQRVRRPHLESLEHNKYAVKYSRGWAWAFWILLVLGSWFGVCRLFGRKLSSTQGVSLKIMFKNTASKIQQTKHRQAVFICVSFATCRVFARVSPLHKRIIVQACGCKHSVVFDSHPSFLPFFCDDRRFTEKYINTNMHTCMRLWHVYVVRPYLYDTPPIPQRGRGGKLHPASLYLEHITAHQVPL